MKYIALCHAVTIHLQLGANIPMGVTFYNIEYKNHPAPMGMFFGWLPAWKRKNS